MSEENTTVVVHIPNPCPDANEEIYSYRVYPDPEPVPTYTNGTTITLHQGENPSLFEQDIEQAIMSGVGAAIDRHFGAVDGQLQARRRDDRRMVDDRIPAVLERIAVALERQADADPLTMIRELAAGDDAGDPFAPPREPFAGNGRVFVYAAPVDGWHIVARLDPAAACGFIVTVEAADG